MLQEESVGDLPRKLADFALLSEFRPLPFTTKALFALSCHCCSKVFGRFLGLGGLS